jgi:hypothetical protein
MWHPEKYTTETKAITVKLPEEIKLMKNLLRILEKNWESKTSSDVIM